MSLGREDSSSKYSKRKDGKATKRRIDNGAIVHTDSTVWFSKSERLVDIFKIIDTNQRPTKQIIKVKIMRMWSWKNSN